jgi:hypothetical protein
MCDMFIASNSNANVRCGRILCFKENMLASAGSYQRCFFTVETSDLMTLIVLSNEVPMFFCLNVRTGQKHNFA